MACRPADFVELPVGPPMVDADAAPVAIPSLFLALLALRRWRRSR
jgi:hypothetical protein